MKRLYRLFTAFLALSLFLVTALPAFAANKVETIEDGKLLIGMEAGYPPYNWTQNDDSNGGVTIRGSSDYANGYDVAVAQIVADELGLELEVIKIEWDGLIPALQADKIDLIAAGMSPTPERAEAIDFTNPYYTVQFAMLVMKDGEFAEANSINDFEGATVTGQLSTLHYDLLDQLKGAKVDQAMPTFPAMRVALESGKIDAYVTEIPEALSATAANDKFKYVELNPSFELAEEETQISMGVKKGNPLLGEINKILDTIDEDQRAEIMEKIIEIQPKAE